jgi:diguanylate cyclase (GGDEF)-like protein
MAEAAQGQAPQIGAAIMQRNNEEFSWRRELDRSEEIQRQIQALSSRDWQLWSIGILVMLVFSAGFLALIFPSLSWRREINLNSAMLPQFFFGLIALIVLFNVYVVSQKRTLNATRHELMKELIFSERIGNLSMLDPLTELVNQRGVDQALSHEVARANRLGTQLSLMMMKLESLPVVNGRHGSATGDRFIADVAKLLKTTFRGSDIVARLGGDEFLAVLPNTNEQQAECARRRVQETIDQWNLNTKNGLEISLAFGIVCYAMGSNASDLLRSAQRKVMAKRRTLVPVFVPVEAASGRTRHMIV